MSMCMPCSTIGIVKHVNCSFGDGGGGGLMLLTLLIYMANNINETYSPFFSLLFVECVLNYH